MLDLNTKPILHIVKRYGPVGGMENYVWELTHSLAANGVNVHVLCLESHDPIDSRVVVHHLSCSRRQKPRWLAMLLFSRGVSKWIKQFNLEDFIIHSHERTAVHHLTTIHGTFIAKRRSKLKWFHLSPRILVWVWLENRELCRKNVRFVVPNSSYIEKQIHFLYPSSSSRVVSPICPGVDIITRKRVNDNIASHEYTVGFMGVEWKRKGLKKIIEIMSAIKEKTTFPVKLIVAGPCRSDIEHFFEGAEFSFELVGFIDRGAFFDRIDVLVHPAKKEAYGMVVAESTHYGVPVVVSSNCGVASEVTPSSGYVLDLSQSCDQWAETIISFRQYSGHVDPIGKTWKQITYSYMALYNRIEKFYGES